METIKRRWNIIKFNGFLEFLVVDFYHYNAILNEKRGKGKRGTKNIKYYNLLLK